jgi:hypothetical protein
LLLLAEEGLDEDTAVEMDAREEHVPLHSCTVGEEDAEELVVTVISL